ncbi:MAG: ATP-binding protein [Syntrophomonadaceae bacterium]|nr:ATP-binding protein [Syntrophomonadaceae bacterium]
MRPTQRWIMSRVRKAIKDFNLISPGDRIAVGLSGGKDSLGLLYVLSQLRRFRQMAFDLLAIYVDLGWTGIGIAPAKIEPLRSFCQELQVPLVCETTKIAEIVFTARQEPNPCALCANLRRGALNNAAKGLGCQKVALGHHADDVIETYLLNLFYNAQMNTFSPRTNLTRSGLTLIRPLVYLEEKAISQLAQEEGFPTIENPCPVSGKTKRQEIKEIVRWLNYRFPEIRQRFLTALKNFKPESFQDWNPDQVR